MMIPLAEGINISNVGTVRLRTFCNDNSASLVLDLKRVDGTKPEGRGTIEMTMEWKDLDYMLAEDFEVSFVNDSHAERFRLERIGRERMLGEKNEEPAKN